MFKNLIFDFETDGLGDFKNSESNSISVDHN